MKHIIKRILLSGVLALLSIQVTNADQKVGTPDGEFSVSPLGGAVYSVSIDCPKGIGDMVPKIALSYNSQAGYGHAGYGVSLSGISVITHGMKDLYHDDNISGVSYGNNDAYYLDGKRLLFKAGQDGGDGAEYTIEGDPYTTITIHGSYQAQTMWFEVHSSDGKTIRYGATSDSRICYSNNANSPRILAWYVSRIEDANTNYISYTYQTTDLFTRPSTITYGGNTTAGTNATCSIVFSYESLGTDPLPFAVEDQTGYISMRLYSITSYQNNALYRRYNFAYDTSMDGCSRKFARLTQITEYNGNNECMNPVVLMWNCMPGMQTTREVTSVGTGINNSVFQTLDRTFLCADLNGDGVDDIVRISHEYLQTSPSTWQTEVSLYLHCSQVGPDGSVTFLSLGGESLDVEVSNDGWANIHNGGFVADINGDGYNDLIIPYYQRLFDTSRIKFVYFSGKEIASGVLEKSVFSEDLTASNRLPLTMLAETNGDGLYDIVCLERGNTYNIYSYKSITPTDTSFHFSTYDHEITITSEPHKAFRGDYNDDGLIDLFVLCDSGYKIFMNYGGDSTTPKYTNLKAVTGTNLSGAWRMEQGDFNGDGLIDFIIAERNSSYLDFALNNGDGTFTRQHAVDLELQDQSTSQDDDRYNIVVADFDHDGRSDVLVIKALYFPVYLYTIVLWYRSTGNGLTLVKNLMTDGEDDALAGNTSLGDFDGDGCPEILHYGKDIWNGGTGGDDELAVYQTATNMYAKGRVTHITDGLGRTVDISYAPLTHPSVYQRSSGTVQYPLCEHTSSLPVVSSVTRSNGAAGSNTAVYQYRGLKTQMTGKGLLGFSGTTVTNDSLNTQVTKDIIRWDGNRWIPVKTFTQTSSGNAVNTVEDSLKVVSIGYRNYFAHPFRKVKTDPDGNEIYTYYYYDTLKGVLNTENTSWDNSHYNKIITYGNYTLSGGRYLPQSITQEMIHYHDWGGYTSQTNCSYDSRGNAISITEHAGTAQALTKSRTYDAYGNITSEALSGSNVSTPVHYWTYCNGGRDVQRAYTSPSTTTVSYIYDSPGHPSSRTEEGYYYLVTDYEYDTWGTLTKETSPTGVVTNYTEGWGYSAAQRYYHMKSTAGQPWVKTWYDEYGREVLTESKGPDNTDVCRSTSYDKRGRAVSTASTEGLLAISQDMVYDNRDRLVSDTYSTGLTASYTYNNHTVTANVNGHETSKTFDAWGNVLTSTDSLSTVSYTYYSNGCPSMISSEGVAVTMEYDAACNRTLISDPDAGTVSSVYSADGHLLSQTDARGIQTTYTYTSSGLLQSQQTGSHSVTNTYCTPAPRLLLLQSTSSPVGSITYGYDMKNRVTSETRTFSNGTVLNYSYAYNNQGHLSQKTFPNGLTVNYHYDGYGYLTDMSIGNQEVWRLNSHNGIRDSITYLDSIAYTAQHDANGNLTRQQWWKGTTSIGKRKYIFDGPTGNLLERNLGVRMHVIPGWNPFQSGGLVGTQWVVPGGEPIFPFPDISAAQEDIETFTYDGLDRLTNVVGQRNAQSMTIDYASNGNILSKTLIGNYTYDSTMHPHAVIGVTNPNTKIPLDTLETVFGDLNLIDTISNGSATATFRYGPDLQRWTSVTTCGDSTTHVIYAGDYERVTYGSGLVREFYYLGHGIIVVRQNGTFIPLLAMTDYQGSIIRIVNGANVTQFSADYDAWGQQTINRNNIGFLRGYTGHEMLPKFGLINMNGRLYDPQIGRFLSPDNYVQEPYSSQSFNRYSYCMNNPLKYVDPDGEFWWIVAAGLIGGAVNLGIKAYNGQIHGWGDGLMAFGIGFTAGAVGAATGGAALSVAGGAGMGGFFGGAFSGAVGATYSTVTLGIANNVYFGDPLPSNGEFLTTVFTSALTAGLINGAASSMNGKTFWMGKERMVPAMQIEPLEPVEISRTQPTEKLFLQERQSFETHIEKVNSYVGQTIENDYPIAPRFISSPEGPVVDLDYHVERIFNKRFYTFNHENTLYYNKKATLPISGGPYNEFVVPTPATNGINHVKVGTMRIVVGSKNNYYFTPDHYDTFFKIKVNF